MDGLCAQRRTFGSQHWAMGTFLNAIVCCFFCPILQAASPGVSPETIAQGKMLFEKRWTPQNPLLGGDGLGPLFNGRSCAECHHRGGIGGSGDARFNAQTIAIDRFKPSGALARRRMTLSQFAAIFAQFHPGFVNSGGQITSSFPLPHHGGTLAYSQMRSSMLDGLPAQFSEQGGPANAEEVRTANATPIIASQMVPSRSGAVTIKARLYQRNTTALFGAGLIDRIDLREIQEIARQQARHPEISGRFVGRFGWRGQSPSLVNFNDQACANELGLQTRRARQMSDPTARNYRHRGYDISDEMIETMTEFVAALPAPTRELPTDPVALELVMRGEKYFKVVGCAVCHVPDVGPAKGIYSDILVHDMGNELFDPNMASTGVNRAPVMRTGGQTTGRTGGRTVSSSRQGFKESVESLKAAASQAKAGTDKSTMAIDLRGRSGSSPNMALSPTGTQRRSQEVTRSMAPSNYYGAATLLTLSNLTRTNSGEYVRPQTQYHQEWRTPPLWGVRDSAPYMHDGRAGTLLEAIAMHDGEALATRDRFLSLALEDRRAIIAFLETMVAPTAGL